MKQVTFTCPCCGYNELTVKPYRNMPTIPLAKNIYPPYSIYWGEPSYDVCDCCGFEFGNDDEPGGQSKADSFNSYLERWKSGGCHWFNAEKKPNDWTLERQLASAPLSDNER